MFTPWPRFKTRATLGLGEEVRRYAGGLLDKTKEYVHDKRILQTDRPSFQRGGGREGADQRFAGGRLVAGRMESGESSSGLSAGNDTELQAGRYRSSSGHLIFFLITAMTHDNPNALYSLSFQLAELEGQIGGVVSLIEGKIYGGDSSFSYQGTYCFENNGLTITLRVKAFNAGSDSIFSEFEETVDEMIFRGMVHSEGFDLSAQVNGIEGSISLVGKRICLVTSVKQATNQGMVALLGKAA